MIKAIIFDYFGVIRPDVLYATYEQLGGDTVKDHDFIEDTVHAAHRGLIPNSREPLAERLGVSVDEYMSKLQANMGSNDESLMKFIAELKPKYKIGLLSNTSSPIGEMLSSAEQALFDAVVLSDEDNCAKPDPEAYQLVASRLGLEPGECLFTDDHEEFCEAARVAGMPAIHYKSLAQFKKDLNTLLAT